MRIAAARIRVDGNETLCPRLCSGKDDLRRATSAPNPSNEATTMATMNPFERPARALEDTQLTAPPDDEEDLPEPQEEAAPQRHEDVVARVRELLGKYPNLGSRQLYDLAIRMHPDLEQAGFRSFHARYVLPLKREKARAEGRLPKPRTPRTVAKRPRKGRSAQLQPELAESAARLDAPQLRSRVRDVMLRLARQVAVAESRADLVDALAGVEDMVEEVMHAVQPQQPENKPAMAEPQE